MWANSQDAAGGGGGGQREDCEGTWLLFWTQWPVGHCNENSTWEDFVESRKEALESCFQPQAPKENPKSSFRARARAGQSREA